MLGGYAALELAAGIETRDLPNLEFHNFGKIRNFDFVILRILKSLTLAKIKPLDP